MFEETKIPPRLMYRRPGGERHENITDVLNEILQRLDEIESKLQNKVLY